MFFALTLVLGLGACSALPYRHGALEDSTLVERAQQQQKGALLVRAAVPSFEEAERLFGIPLRSRGIQPVWLEIVNTGEDRARFAPYSVDPDYFPPHEVAYMYRKRFSQQGWQDMERRLHELSMPRQIAAGATVSGFVFTHQHPGTKAFNVDVHYVEGDGSDAHFMFFINVPDFVPDHAGVDFANLYAPGDILDLDEAGLRETIAASPCCATNRAGVGQGRPVNLVLVAPGKDLLQALLRAGWEETSYVRDEDYLEATEYLFGRPADAVLRQRRGRKTDRNELHLWLAPWRHEGTPVWIGQVRHAIGRLFEFQELFLGVQLDPDSAEGRNFLLQNLWYSQSLLSYAWSASGLDVPESAPIQDFLGREFYTDGMRLVLWVSGDTVALTDARSRHWDQVIFEGSP